MSALEDNIKRVNGKVQLLLKKLFFFQKENERLFGENEVLKTQEEKQRLYIEQLEQQVTILKSSAGQLSVADKKVFEKNINQYIREIDKCIGLLSE